MFLPFIRPHHHAGWWAKPWFPGLLSKWCRISQSKFLLAKRRDHYHDEEKRVPAYCSLMKSVFKQLFQDLKLKWIVLGSVNLPKITNSWLLNLFSQCCMKISSFCREKLSPKTYLEKHYFCCPIEDLALRILAHRKDRVHPSPLSSVFWCN